MTLDDFIKAGRARAKALRGMGGLAEYVEEPGFHRLYVRYGSRYVNGVKYAEVLDLANMTVSARKRGKGIMTKMIQRLQEQYPTLHLYAECVNNPRLPEKLKSLGFVDTTIDRCFFLEAKGQ